MHEKEFQLPYDKCVQIDKEVDALLEEEKKQYYINNLKNDIKMYEKSLTEKKKQLEELEKL